ncbi:MAG: recombinase family protein [Micromonosporaceae bacterium]|nr:recombinase family protein [Micromonosporaceae bacterium]
MSKGERNRIKVRVRTAMTSQAKLEGRFLGGRPPYGYRLVDLGPHPNPAKAADGRHLRGLAPDENTAPVVARIFAEFCAGWGIYLIAEGLTRDGVPCPSAYDRKRNPHRTGIAWSKSAVRVILTNPRYTGRQVWNKQRKDEILLDVEDVALGHTGVMRWNPADQWTVSNEIVHSPLVDQGTFDTAQALLTRRGRGRRPGQEYRRERTLHAYILRGLVYCALCNRKMQGQRSHDENYYRCRYAEEYALANKFDHPRNIYLRELDLIDPLDAALAEAFTPQRVGDTITAMVDSQDQPDSNAASALARSQLAECDTKLGRHRAALEAGADPSIVTGWIAEVEAERRRILATIDRPTPKPQRMTREEITALVQQVGEVIEALRAADLADRAEVYQQLGLRLTYHPDQRKVRVQSQLAAHPGGESGCVRGGT